MKVAKSIDKFTRNERVKFLRETARDVKLENVEQAATIVLLRDGSIGWTILNPRGRIAEVIEMCERAKLEMFVDVREQRRDDRNG